MNRNEFKAILLDNGFMFKGSQKGFPGRGEEDKYTHPKYSYSFYVTRINKDDRLVYGFLTGKINGKKLNKLYPHNENDTFAPDKNLYVWTSDSFHRLVRLI